MANPTGPEETWGADRATLDSTLAVAASGTTLMVEGVGDAETDDTEAFVKAFVEAKNGDTVRLKAGKRYRVSGRIDVDLLTRSLTFDGAGSEIIFDAFDDGITFDAGWTTITTFEALSAVGLSITGVAGAEALRVRDYVRIYSDDKAPDAYSGSAFQAEDVFVESRADDVLNFLRPSGVVYGAQVPFKTLPRVAQRSGHTVRIVNLKVSNTERAIAGSFNSRSLIEVVACMYPVIEGLDCPYAVCPSLETKACIGARVVGGHDGPHPDYGFAGDGSSRGYGVRDASLNTRITGRSAVRCRHAIDTHEQSYGGLAPSPAHYGSAVGLRSLVCSADDCTNDAFATHHSARKVQFLYCSARRSAQYAFGVRGEATLIGCHGEGCVGGWRAFDEGNAMPARTRLTMRDCVWMGCGPSRNQNHLTPVEAYNERWIDGRYATTIWLAQNYDDTVTRFYGHTVVRPSDERSTGSPLFGTTVKGTIEFEVLELDLTVPTATFVPVIDCRGAGAPVSFYRLLGDKMVVKGAAASIFFRRDANYPPAKEQLLFSLIFEPGVATWTGSQQNNLTNIQVCGANDLAALGGVNVLNPNDQYGPAKVRQETLSLDFGVAPALGSEMSALARVNGFKAGDVLSAVLSSADPRVEMVRVRVLSDNQITVDARNIAAAPGDAVSEVSVRAALTR